MPYCLYVRKSRADAEAEAHGEGETLARHTNTLLELAKRRHLDITQIYKEIVSGETIASRPVVQQLLSEVGQGIWDGVLVMEVERLARGDTIDQGIVAQTFKFSGTKIITPLKDYDPNNEFDEEYFEFGLFMSRREYKTTRRRLERGRIASVQEGNFVGNVAPYGYRRVKNKTEKGFSLEPEPDEADIVKLIFELYTKGVEQPDGSFRRLGVSLIVRYLDDLHIPPRKGVSWSNATVRDILKNPTYTGKVRWNRRATVKKMIDGSITKSRPRSENYILADGKHPALVDKDTFEMVQKLITQTPPVPIQKNNSVMNPLSGLMVCSKCGRRMTRRPYSKQKHEDTLICTSTACNNVGSNLSAVEAHLLDALKKWLDEYRVEYELDKPTVPNNISAKKKNLSRLINEYTTLKKQLDSAHDFLEQGIYTTDQFLERSRKLSERIHENETARAQLEKEIDIENKREIGRRQIIPKVEHLLAVYDTLPSPKAKNDILKEVLEKVIYTKEHRGTIKTPTEFELVLYPVIPKTM